MARAYVIAEIGSNHGGELIRALEAIAVYAEVGFDAVKLQWTSDGEKMARRRGKAAADGYGAYYSSPLLQWPREWHRELSRACERTGIDYMCSVYLPEDVSAVAPWVSRFKVASFEAGDAEIREAHAQFRERVVCVSTGMSTARDVRRIRAEWERTVPGLRLLHCVSAYPVPIAEAQLGVLRSGLYHGYSDHTAPHLTWTGGVAFAALPYTQEAVIEAHVRAPGQDRSLPDADHSMVPQEALDYVRCIRAAGVAVGEGVRRVQESETTMMAYRVGGE